MSVLIKKIMVIFVLWFGYISADSIGVTTDPFADDQYTQDDATHYEDDPDSFTDTGENEDVEDEDPTLLPYS